MFSCFFSVYLPYERDELHRNSSHFRQSTVASSGCNYKLFLVGRPLLANLWMTFKIPQHTIVIPLSFPPTSFFRHNHSHALNSETESVLAP